MDRSRSIDGKAMSLLDLGYNRIGLVRSLNPPLEVSNRKVLLNLNVSYIVVLQCIG